MIPPNTPPPVPPQARFFQWVQGFVDSFYDLHMLVQMGGRERTAEEFLSLLEVEILGALGLVLPGCGATSALHLDCGEMGWSVDNCAFSQAGGSSSLTYRRI